MLRLGSFLLVVLVSVVSITSPCAAQPPGPAACQMITTQFSNYVQVGNPSSGLDPNAIVVRRSDVSNAPVSPGLWNPAMASHPSWTAFNLGQVFGLAIDDAAVANIYVAASNAYGNFTGDPARFGLGGSGLGGEIYRLDGLTGTVSLFAQLPNQGPALGNLAFAPGLGASGTGVLFAANLDDGLLYSIEVTPSGTAGTISTSPVFPGVAPHALGSFAPLGERPFAVAFNPVENRLYYSIWQGSPASLMAPWSANAPAPPGPQVRNTIWSIGVNPNGSFSTATPVLERYLPYLTSVAASNPVTDIAFSECAIDFMVVAERTMLGDYGQIDLGHEARVFQFVGASIGVTGGWVPSSQTFQVGTSSTPPEDAAGGIDFDSASNLYATGDTIAPGSYGVQRLPAGGNTNSSTTLVIPFPGTPKSGMGDVEYHEPLDCDCADDGPCPRQDLTVVLHTGWDQATNSAIPLGQADDDWVVTRDSNTAGSAIAPPWSTTLEPKPPVVINAAAASWGSAQNDANGNSTWLHSGADHNSTIVTYQMCFCLRGGFANANLLMSVLADDEADVYLNGHFLGTTGVPGFSAPTLFSTTNPSHFRVGQNCLEIRVTNDILVAGLNVVGTVTADGGTCCCTPRPPGLVSWWPLEGSGGVEIDIAGVDDASLFNPDVQPGRVGNALNFTSQGSATVVAPSPKLASIQRFSVDAWVQIDCDSACPVPNEMPIVTKYDPSIGRGFELFVQAGSGLLGARIHGSLGTVSVFQSALPDLLDNQWHLIVLTYDGIGTAELWSDGARVGSTTVPPPIGTVASGSASLTIGTSSASGSLLRFPGWIDEVEVFDRVLNGQQVRALAAAPNGKCREGCYVPFGKTATPSSVVTVPITICNDTQAAQSYVISYVGNSACALPAPSVAASTPLPMTVNVAPGCSTFHVDLQLPAGTGASCFDLCITNVVSGEVQCCEGRYVLGSGVSIFNPLPLELTPGFAEVVEFELTNPDVSADFNSSYQIELLPVPRDGSVQPGSLDGLPPGEPVRRDVGLPPEFASVIGVTVVIEESDPASAFDLVFSLDPDGDGSYEPVSSITLLGRPPVHTLSLGSVSTAIDAFDGVDVEVRSTYPVDAVATSVEFDPATIELFDLDLSGTTTEALGVDFLAVEVHSGGLTTNVLLTNPLPAGVDHLFGRLVGTALPAPGPVGTAVTFVDEVFGSPPTVNAIEALETPVTTANGLALTDASVELQPNAGPTFLRSDCNADGASDLGDAIFLLNFIFFVGSPVPQCADACDMNDDGMVNIGDPIHQLGFQFSGGPAPTTPFPACGEDPTDDNVDCLDPTCAP